MTATQTAIVTVFRWIGFCFWLILLSIGPAVSIAAPVENPAFKKVFIIVFENSDADKTMAQPYFKSMAARGAYLQGFYAVTHPSQPNYIAMTSASTHGVSDNDKHNLNVASIADLLEAKGKTWKTYNDDYPGNCSAGTTYGKYARRHQPFISYDNIRKNSARCAHIVNSKELATDVANGTLPDYSFYVPNVDNDGHETGVGFADVWLRSTFDGYFSDPKFMQDMLVVLTFDEDDSGDNRIYTVLFGNGVKAGTVSNTRYGFYDLLRTIEEGMGLGTLGLNDQSATAITGVWN